MQDSHIPTQSKKSEKVRSSFFLTAFFSYCRKNIFSLDRASRKKTFLLVLPLFFVLITTLFFIFEKEIKSATFGWTQSSWIGGPSASPATHQSDQANWDKYTSKDPNLTVDASGVSITGTNNSWVTTSDGDWNSGTNGGVYVNGGTMYAKRPGGSVCTAHAECASNTCYQSLCADACSATTAVGNTCGFGGFVYSVVTAMDGRQWLDRNLGATRVATSSADTFAYGHYYQWGRGTDGHQLTTSLTIATQSSSDTPGHAKFISGNTNWRNPQNNSLWQGVNGINNPCPTGFRLPTSSEWGMLVTAEGITNSATAYASTLKLPVAGLRSYSDGSWFNQGRSGYYWSSSVSGSYGLYLTFYSSSVDPAYSSHRAHGCSIRCLKN